MKYKIIIGGPDDQEVIERIIDVAAQAGAGTVGKYRRCAVINKIVATWTPGKGSNPYEGEIGKPTVADCVFIDIECDEQSVRATYDAIKKIHPYDEPGIQIIKLEDIESF